MSDNSHFRGQPFSIPPARQVHKEIRAKVDNWKKSGKTGYIAHRIMTAGSEYFTTACGVLLDKKYAVDATIATMRCVECRERTGEE